jgi:hypothetical protein
MPLVLINDRCSDKPSLPLIIIKLHIASQVIVQKQKMYLSLPLVPLYQQPGFVAPGPCLLSAKRRAMMQRRPTLLQDLRVFSSLKGACACSTTARTSLLLGFGQVCAFRGTSPRTCDNMVDYDLHREPYLRNGAFSKKQLPFTRRPQFASTSRTLLQPRPTCPVWHSHLLVSAFHKPDDACRDC